MLLDIITLPAIVGSVTFICTASTGMAPGAFKSLLGLETTCSQNGRQMGDLSPLNAACQAVPTGMKRMLSSVLLEREAARLPCCAGMRII
jgi:hypothetical protein